MSSRYVVIQKFPEPTKLSTLTDSFLIVLWQSDDCYVLWTQNFGKQFTVHLWRRLSPFVNKRWSCNDLVEPCMLLDLWLTVYITILLIIFHFRREAEAAALAAAAEKQKVPAWIFIQFTSVRYMFLIAHMLPGHKIIV